MINLSNFILPYVYKEATVEVLDNKKEALLVKEKTKEPFLVSKASVLPRLNKPDIYIDSLIGTKGKIRYSELGYLPVMVRDKLPFHNHIPYYRLAGETPPPFEFELFNSPQVRYDDYREAEELIKYLLDMRRLDYAFILAYTYYVKVHIYTRTYRMDNICWQGIPHISPMYVRRADNRLVFVPTNSYGYKALSNWWGISGGYHNRKRRFIYPNRLAFSRLLQSSYSPFLQCGVKTKPRLLTKLVHNEALPPAVKPRIKVKGVVYNHALYVQGVPYYYSSRLDHGDKPKIWWSNQWFSQMQDYMDPLLFDQIVRRRENRLSRMDE